MPWGVLMLVAGLILVLAGSGWFAGAATVGWILIVVSVLLMALTLVILTLAASTTSSRRSRSSINRRF